MDFNQIKIQSLLGGIISRFPFGVYLNQKIRGLISSEPDRRPLDYGLNVLKHRQADLDMPSYNLRGKVFLEIAPGDNLSGLIAAVSLGAEKAIAIDAYDYTDFSVNKDIINLFEQKNVGKESRRQEIRDDLSLFSKYQNSTYFSYFAPWSSSDIDEASVDLITSLSTMEHVKDPEKLYKAAHAWLKPGGLMIHKIDFSSHGMTKDWFGHLLISDRLFSLIEGRKTTHINRWTETQHLSACQKCGFVLRKRLAFPANKTAPNPYQDLPYAATHIWQK